MILNEILRKEYLDISHNVLFIAGKEFGVLNKKMSFQQFCDEGFAIKIKCKNALYDNIEIVDEYIASNFDHLSSSQIEILNSYKKRIENRFIFLKCLSKHAIVINTTNNNVYAVKGITNGFDEIFDYFPILIETSLLSFNNLIIADGFYKGVNMQFGKNYRNSFNEIYVEAKADKKIITSF